MFNDYIKAFDSDLASVVQFTGVAILVLGFSNFFWYPILQHLTKIEIRLTFSGFQSKHVLVVVRF